MIANLTASKFQSLMHNLESRTLVFIDENVENYPVLETAVKNGLAIFCLDRGEDGIQAITERLQKMAAIHGLIDEVHIISHGSPGSLQLGSAYLNSDTLDGYVSQLQKWHAVLSKQASILIYGCRVAAGETGATFVKQLSQLTGANIAASVDLTGNAASGGNWDLEFTTAEIKMPSIFLPEAIAAYRGVLAILTVTNAADSGAGSLRDAIAKAQSGDTIQFASSLANQTITLTSGQLEIDKTLIIDGANTPGLTISGNNASRVINLQPTQNLTVKNLIVANGKVTSTDIQEGGAGIKAGDSSILTVENCQLNNNIARLGAGIFAFAQSTLTVSNSKFDGNDATSGQGLSYVEQSGGAIVAFVAKSLTVTNSEFTNNKGINGGAINNLLTPVTIENSTFLNNDTTAGASMPGLISGYGGAVYSDGASKVNTDNIGGDFIIRNSRFEGNKGAGQGGGLYLYVYPPDKVAIESSTIINNSVIKDDAGDALGGGFFYGAGLANGGPGNSPLKIDNTTFANNVAQDQGGGLWVGGQAPLAITNSTFSGNEALDGGNGFGGAMTIFNNAYPTNIVNTTIAYNKAAKVAGAIFHGDEQQITVKNTIFADNTASNPLQNQQQVSRLLIDGGNNIQWPDKLTTIPFPGDLNVTNTVTIANPLLGPLQDNGGGILTHALLPGSPAIDSGTSTGAPTTDQRGMTRPIDGDNNGSALVDIGAYEFMTASPEIQVLDNTTNIADGTTTAIDFGPTLVNSPITKTFTINNTGSAELTLGNLQLPDGFTVVGTLPSTVASGAQANLSVNLNASAAGTFNGEVSFINNDSDENPFNFSITGIVNTPTPTPNPIPTPTPNPIPTPTPNPIPTPTPNPIPTPTPNPIPTPTPDPTDTSCLCDRFPTPNISIDNPLSNAVTITLNGTNSADTIAGSDVSEAIFGNAGNDILTGMGDNDNIDGGVGNDLLYGNVGDDFINGDTGNDTIFGGKDNDAINGGADSDIISGDIGNDTIIGSDGNDLLYGHIGDDFIDGDTGEDTIFSGQDNDIIKGGASNDIIASDIGNDTICGGDGNDQLYGNAGNDLMDGCEGDDTLFGGQDNDSLTGGIGDDSIYGDFGNDTLTGSDGRDRFVLSANRGSDVIADFTDGVDLLGLDVGLSFAQLSITSGAIATEIKITSTGELLASLQGVQVTLIAANDFTTI